MAEDDGKQEEKFEFASEGEGLGYISLDRARVLSMRTARELPGAFGRRFRRVPMAFEVVSEEETEDHYVVTLSFRPQGQFTGTPGQEQFFIEKEGAIAHRQVLSLPEIAGGRRFLVIPVITGLLVVGIGAVVGVAFSIGGLGRGSDEESKIPAVPSEIPLVVAATVAPTTTSTPNSTPTTRTATAASTTMAAPSPTAAPRMEPMATPVPIPTPILAATPTPGPKITRPPPTPKTATPTPNAAPTPTTRPTSDPYLHLGSVGEEAKAFATPILSAIADVPPDFEDDFSAADDDWQWRRYPDSALGTMRIQDGVMRISGLEGRIIISADKLKVSKDFVLQVDARIVKGDLSSQQKVFFHSYGREYYFDFEMISGNKSWLVRKKARGQSSKIAQGIGEVSAIGQTTRLMAVVRGDHGVIYINGKPIAYLTDPDLGISPGAITFHCLSISEAVCEFDNVRFWNLANVPNLPSTVSAAGPTPTPIPSPMPTLSPTPTPKPIATPTPLKVVVEPATVTLDAGFRIALSVKVFDKSGNAALSPLVSWQAAPEAGSIDEGGVFTAATHTGFFP